MKDLNNQLYWLAEELKSYTDLSEERFDISHAQKRVWSMNPILKNNDLPDVQDYYNELDELLENALLFDKLVFSEKVNQLFSLLEEKKGA
jgi:hypothetical protein